MLIKVREDLGVSSDIDTLDRYFIWSHKPNDFKYKIIALVRVTFRDNSQWSGVIEEVYEKGTLRGPLHISGMQPYAELFYCCSITDVLNYVEEFGDSPSKAQLAEMPKPAQIYFATLRSSGNPITAKEKAIVAGAFDDRPPLF